MLLGLQVPHYTLPCKRAACVGLPKLSCKRFRTVILDSSGLKVLGEGEWKRKIHGKGTSRKWIKVHLAIDAKTQEIVAEMVTEAYFADSKAAIPLLAKTPQSVKTVLADGAYDGRSVREEIRQRKAKALIPPSRNAHYLGEEDVRDGALRLIRGLGKDEGARRLWGKLTGYSCRALVETTFSRMKGLFGERLFSKKTENQRIETRLRCVLLNKMIRQAA